MNCAKCLHACHCGGKREPCKYKHVDRCKKVYVDWRELRLKNSAWYYGYEEELVCRIDDADCCEVKEPIYNHRYVTTYQMKDVEVETKINGHVGNKHIEAKHTSVQSQQVPSTQYEVYESGTKTTKKFAAYVYIKICYCVDCACAIAEQRAGEKIKQNQQCCLLF